MDTGSNNKVIETKLPTFLPPGANAQYYGKFHYSHSSVNVDSVE